MKQKGVTELNAKFKKYVSLIYAISPCAAFAGGETPVGDGLNYIINAMYGETGIAVATLAVMIVGLLCLAHMLRWAVLGYTIMGVSIIFGADSIVRGITSLLHRL